MAKTKVTAAPKPQKAVIKTTQNNASVEDFINAVPDEQKRKDSFEILKMMKAATKEEPRMWGASLIGFGHITVTSPATGRTVDWFRLGFSPRKANLSLYMGLDVKKYAASLKKLGKHKTGMGCLYINKLEDIDLKVLREMFEISLKKK